MRIEINAEYYETVGRIREPQPPFVRGFNSQGGQQRFEGQQIASSVRLPAPTEGFGLRRINDWNDSRQFRRMWDSQCETRFPTAVYQPISPTNVSLVADDDVIYDSVEFGGNLWGLWSRVEAGVGYRINARNFSPEAWANPGGSGIFAAAGANPILPLAIIAHKHRMITLYATANDHIAKHSTDGITWTAAATTALPLNLLANNIADADITAMSKFGMLSQVGNEAIALLYEESNGVIALHSTADTGDTWSVSEVDIPSGGGPTGTAVMPGIDGTDKLYVGTREGVWEVDTTPATWTANLIYSIPSHPDNCNQMLYHQGGLWVPLGVDDSSPAPLTVIYHSGDTRSIVESMGLDKDDGVPTEMLGPFRWLAKAGRFLFASVGGGASSGNARILCHNGLGWHFMYRHATANQEVQWIAVSGLDDGTQRLFFAKRTVASGSSQLVVTEYLLNPTTSPASLTTQNRVDDAVLTRPELDGGLPNMPCNWLSAAVDAADLSASNSGDYISLDYGLDGAATTTNLAGDFVSGTKEHTFDSTAGNNDALGVSGASMQPEETLHSNGTGTTTPSLRSTVLTYLKKPPALEQFLMTIDIAASSNEQRSEEQVISALETARDSVPKVVFNHGQKTNNVFLDVAFDEMYTNDEEMLAESREGFARVVCREAS